MRTFVSALPQRTRRARRLAALAACAMTAIAAPLSPAAHASTQATVSPAASVGTALTRGQSLNNGDSLDLQGRQLIMQPDGNLVLYNNSVSPRKVCWASNSSGSNRAAAYAIYQNDGNFVIYNGPGGAVLWASNTVGLSGSTVLLETDGAKVAYLIGIKFITGC